MVKRDRHMCPPFRVGTATKSRMATGTNGNFEQKRPPPIFGSGLLR